MQTPFFAQHNMRDAGPDW